MSKSKKTIRVYGGYNFSWNDDFNVINTNNIEDAHVYALPGGGDIAPSVYGHKNSRSYCYDNTGKATLEIMKRIEYCVKHGIALWGNCLGFQTLGVFAGCTMIQHLSHPSFHRVKTYTGEEFGVINIHHQAICPYIPREGMNPKVNILAWADNLSHVHIGQDGTEIDFPENAFKEIEIAHFPEINAMGAQTHFEMNGCDTAAYDFVKKEIMNRLIFKS